MIRKHRAGSCGKFVLLLLILLILFPSAEVFADAGLTKGACPGGLYIHGVYVGYYKFRLYHSADHGQTVTIQDSIYISTRRSITAGIDPGEIYIHGSGDYLYYSEDYGISFTQKARVTTDCYSIASGNAPGEIYMYHGNTVQHSTDYGGSFVVKETLDVNVDDMSVGINPGEIYIGEYYGEIYHSTDYGETFDQTGYLPGSVQYLSRGTTSGEIYLFHGAGSLYYSPNYGDSLYFLHYFSQDTSEIQGIAGGNNPGEVYVFEEIQYMTGGGEIYIHYSTDYGDSFTVYHPFSTTIDVLPPKAVTDLTCFLSDSSIFLDWSPITKDIWDRPDTIDYYVVYRDTLSQFNPMPEDSIGSSIESEYLDLDVLGNSGQKFFYIVKAVDDSGNKSKPSNIVGMIGRELVSD